LLAALLAPACACCHTVLESPLTGPVCSRCWNDVRLADGRYDGALREIIHAFKYEGRRSLAQPLGSLLRERNTRAFDAAACVVPVPLFAWRRLRRGFNQAADLAARLDLPVVHALWRVRITASQTGLTAAERRRNVRGAFRLSPLMSAKTRARYIEDRVVVLVDDVMTTGATSDACADVLLTAGACEVRVVTLARAALRGST
jgi:ComF family protein